jgi:phosphonate transport system substrate-binding protein
LGAVNSEIFRAMLRDGRLKQDDLRILWETPPYPDYVWAINETVTKVLRTRTRDAFLMLEIGNEVHTKILGAMGTNGFLPAGVAEFAPLKKIADSLSLLTLEK